MLIIKILFTILMAPYVFCSQEPFGLWDIAAPTEIILDLQMPHTRHQIIMRTTAKIKEALYDAEEVLAMRLPQALLGAQESAITPPYLEDYRLSRHTKNLHPYCASRPPPHTALIPQNLYQKMPKIGLRDPF